MPTFSSGPGVYVNEALASNFARRTVAGSSSVFFGEALRGPTEITLVTDWTSYKRLFGNLTNDYDMGYSVYHFFANGGRNAYIARAVSSTAVASTLDVSYDPGGLGAGACPFFTATAVSVGTWGDGITVETTAGLTPYSATTYGTFNVIIKFNGVEVERWPEVSLDPNSSRFVTTLLNTYSNYVTLSAVATDAANEDADIVTAATALASGDQGGALITADWGEAFNKVDTVVGDLTLNAVGLDPSTYAAEISALVTKATTRGDSFVIIDPAKGLTSAAGISSSAGPLASLGNSGYAAHYAPCLQMVDPSKSGPGAIRITYPGGAIAGIMARFANQKTTSAAPAGYAAEVVGALGMEAALSNTDIGSLYESTSVPINSFKALPGAGVVVFGARTLAKTTPDKFIPVRRTLGYLKHQLKELTSFAVFEPNSYSLWASIEGVVEGFLTEFYQRGGLKGRSPAEAYYIICDSTNNTPTSIDQGYVNIDVGVSLLYPAEYIVINLSQWTGGSNAVDTF